MSFQDFGSFTSTGFRGLCVKMFRGLAVAALGLAVAAGQANAQDECRNLRFRGHFRLNSAQRYLDLYQRAQHADQKRQALDNAERVLGEAAASPGNADAFTLWYFFGQVYVGKNDLAGADSALTRAASLANNDEGCLSEINRMRRNAWIPLQNEAVGQIQSQNYDSALVLLRKANVIYRDDPSGFMNMAAAYMAQENYDSAAAAFRLAGQAGTDPARAELRSQAMFNAARIYARANRFAAAESSYRAYMALRPRDVEGPTGLAAVLQAQGKTSEASALYDSLMRNADSLSSFDLFDMGVSLFRAAAADTADEARQRERFQLTARAFEAGLRKNPTHRDALFNLTNAYLAASDTAKVLEAAQRLAAVDSMNRQSLTLLARAHQMNRQQAEVVRMLQKRDSLPFEVSIQRFEPRDSTAILRGAVANLRSSELPGRTITLEFLGQNGQVVATERVELPALNPNGSPGAMYDFNITASGRGIITYRYRL
jgi:tetratricopeptide (TPR) repeat protein